MLDLVIQSRSPALSPEMRVNEFYHSANAACLALYCRTTDQDQRDDTEGRSAVLIFLLGGEQRREKLGIKKS